MKIAQILTYVYLAKKYPSLDASGGRSKFILYYIEENLNVLFLNHQNTETKIVKEIKFVQ